MIEDEGECEAVQNTTTRGYGAETMSDELECFRKAAELGCPDFKVASCGHVSFDFTHPMERTLYVSMPSDKRINRYAAAVCAEWWHQREESIEKDSDGAAKWPHHTAWTIAIEMRDAARAFGKKYGGA